MTRIDVSHVVVADPSSVALVLAGPAARELWPPRSDRVIGAVAPQRPRLHVTVDAPARAGVGFAARVVVHAADTTIGTGRLTIAPGSGTETGCRVRLTLEAADDAADRLRRDAARYLDNLAEMTRARSRAA
jgi:hypothetical protein